MKIQQKRFLVSCVNVIFCHSMIVIDTETFLFTQQIHAIGSQQQQQKCFKYKPNSSISFGRLESASPTTWNKQQLGKFKVL